MRSKLAGAANWTNFIYNELIGEPLIGFTLTSGNMAINSPGRRIAHLHT